MSPMWPCMLSFTCLVLSGLGEDDQTEGAGCCERPFIEKVVIQADRRYYDVGESLTVTCETGYRPSHERISCTRGQTNDTWDHYPWCISQCERPVGEKMVPADRQYYDAGESLTVKCQTGYRPSHKTIKCTDRQTWDVNPRCIAQCKKPQDTDKYTTSGYKDSYDVGEYVTVRCKTGYRLLYSYTTCQSHGQWNPSTWCVERCIKPSISNLEKISPSKEYYYPSEEVRLQCEPGYYPSSDRIQCMNKGERDTWTPTVVCIEVKVTKKSVTPSSIILSIVCTPDRCGDIWTSPLYTCVLHGAFYKECKYSAGDVTFSDLDPFTQYTIRVYHTGQSWPLLQTFNITTPESAPDFVRTPSMEDGTIAWTWSNAQGNITGFQMNIVAWRDYNSSFSLNITEWFPPSITQYKMNLQHGTNYTFHLRGFTSAGGGEYKSTSVETPIGDVTGTSNSTRSSILNLDLASMLWLIVPISTVKLLVFVVLLKIQFSLIAGKTSETDLDRHEKPKEYRILYRKREEEFVSIQNGPDDNVYSDPKEAAHS